METSRRSRLFRRLAVTATLLALAALLAVPVLRLLGGSLVRQDPAEHADAAVILLHGIDVYSRIAEAARLFHEGRVDRVVINGGRKTALVRQWEKAGMKRDWRWEDEYLPVLDFLGVPRDRLVVITAEDAFDTVSEARAVGQALQERGIRIVIVTTSRYHTRRAGFIWERENGGSLGISVAGARDDFFDASRWWRDGRSVKVLLSEYGSWLFLLWRGGFAGT